MQHIITHSGTFHCDELFACATLRLLYGEIPITRTRDNLDTHLGNPNTCVVDVGELLDPPMNNFDHHQSEGAGFHANGVPYAAFGLVWQRIGAQVVQKLAGDQPLQKGDADHIASRIEEMLVLYVDGMDNGALATRQASLPDDPSVQIPVPDIGRIFLAFIPEAAEDYDRSFFEALPLARRILVSQIEYELRILRARDTVAHALKVRPHPKLLLLENACPWVEPLLEYGPKEVAFCIFPSPHDTSWIAQQVPLSAGSWRGRASFPDTWRGLSGEALAAVCGDPQAIFCHRNGFLLRAHTRESAIHLATCALP